MAADPTQNDALIGQVLRRSHDIEHLLKKHFNNPGRSLHYLIDCLGNRLPAVVARAARAIANARNAAAHPEGFTKKKVPDDFFRLCDELEFLIPRLANQPMPVAPSLAEPSLTKPAQKPQPAPKQKSDATQSVAKQPVAKANSAQSRVSNVPIATK